MTMTSWRAARFVALAGALVAVLSLQRGSSAQNLTVSFADALTLYEVGEYESVIRGLRVSIAGDRERLIPMLAREAEAWIASGSKAEVPRRRLVAAVFALELGLAGLDTQWEITKRAVEWACDALRRAGPPTEAERLWHLASLALLEASFEPVALLSARGETAALPLHLKHIAERFPREPRLALAQALLREHEFWLNHIRFVTGVPRHDDSMASVAIPALQVAAGHPETRAEARLRLGFLEHRRGNFETALGHLAFAAEGDDDPTRVYLAHLFTGWAHEKGGRKADAIESFRKASAAVNGLSAALALGVRLYEQDERDEADTVVMAALDPAQAVPDPWKLYGYGDFRRFPQLIARLRALLQGR